MDSLSEGCVIGFNGILHQHYHNFTCRAHTKASIYKLKKETLKHLQNTCEDLYIEINEAKKYYVKESVPYVDFCMPKAKIEGKKPLQVFRHAVARLVKINRNLSKFMDAFEIIKLLKELQSQYNSPAVITKSDESNKKALQMLEALMSKFDDMQRELYDQKVMIRAQSTIKPSPTLKMPDLNKKFRQSVISPSNKKLTNPLLDSDPDTMRLVREIELTQLDHSDSEEIDSEESK